MKVLSVVAALLVTSSAHAWSDKYVDVKNGRTVAVEAVGASSQDGIVSLRVVVKNQALNLIDPKAAVTSEQDGFTCDVQRVILLNSSFDSATKTFTQDYEVKVAWTPGADWSSCTVQVFHPSLQSNSVVLYVEGSGLSPIEERPSDWY
nr:hypothetical protein BdHM001_30680 [Bdellovibrio sp. HM001]